MQNYRACGPICRRMTKNTVFKVQLLLKFISTRYLLVKVNKISKNIYFPNTNFILFSQLLIITLIISFTPSLSKSRFKYRFMSQIYNSNGGH